MLLLQALVIPFIALILVGATFAIGVAGTETSRYTTQAGFPDVRVDDPDSIQAANTPVPVTPFRNYFLPDEDNCP
jgi:hypothetical protein